MAIQFRLAIPSFAQNRVRANHVPQVPPRTRTIFARLTAALLSGLLLGTLSGVVVAGVGTIPTIIEPPPQLLPGNAAPAGLFCGESANESCFPPVDAHCFESGDANCFAQGIIRYDGKPITITIDLASRTIALVNVPAQDYKMGDLLSAWGTPTGFSQVGRAIDVYWDTRSAHLTTCSFQPESRVDSITYSREPAFASAWQGFLSVQSKDCSADVVRVNIPALPGFSKHA